MTYRPRPIATTRWPTAPAGAAACSLPLLSLGLWHNFGDTTPLSKQRAMVHTAFDLGITHFDLANNYGPPYGSAEINFGRILREDLASLPRRADHLQQGRLGHVAGPVRPGRRLAQVRAGEPRPEPAPGGRRLLRHLLLPPLRRRHAARGDDGRAGDGRPRGQGAVRRHLVVLGAARRARRPPSCAPRACRSSSTSPATTCSTGGSSPTCSTRSRSSGAGMIAFTALAQGLLTDKYLDGIPADARINRPGGDSFERRMLSEENLARVRGAQRDRPAARPDAGPDGLRVGAARPAGHDHPDRRELARADPRERRARWPTSTSRRTSWPRSTGSRSRAASTSGRSRARTSPSSYGASARTAARTAAPTVREPR